MRCFKYILASTLVVFGLQALADHHETTATGSIDNSSQSSEMDPMNNPNAMPTDTTEGAIDSPTTMDKHSQEFARSTVKEAQQRLSEKGHQVTVDGIVGPKTKNALTDFQTEQNLAATGSLNSETMQALGISTDSDTAPADRTRRPASVNEGNNQMDSESQQMRDDSNENIYDENVEPIDNDEVLEDQDPLNPTDG